MAEFFDMGGYAAFVWPAFGVTFLVMAMMVVGTLRRLRATQRELARLEAAGARRSRGGAETAGADAQRQGGQRQGGQRRDGQRRDGRGEVHPAGAEQRGVEA
ncbi:MAG: heme exporter protein CcmD [Kiloniellales bacterium]|nr:heme exporter protein CcmD [Kiloniellales bacterium]